MLVFGLYCSVRKAFTLLELLVVVAIFSILSALLMPALDRAKKQSKKVQDMNNLRQLGLALHTYAADNEGFPHGTDVQEWAGWFCFIVPYFDPSGFAGNWDPADDTEASTLPMWKPDHSILLDHQAALGTFRKSTG